MYNAQTTIERVQNAIKQKGDTQKRVLDKCGLSENTLKRMTDKTGMASFNLAKIADELDCSVDYLLGRTDNPQAHKPQTANTVNGSYNAVGSANSVTVTNTAATLDEYQQRLLELFNKLTVDERTKLIQDLNKE